MKNKTIKESWADKIDFSLPDKDFLLSITAASHTCCNIEVSEPKGTEVMCSECKEWVTTK